VSGDVVYDGSGSVCCQNFFFPSVGSYAAVERQYIQVSVNVASGEYLVGC
jgi:hypothetical protein